MGYGSVGELADKPKAWPRSIARVSVVTFVPRSLIPLRTNPHPACRQEQFEDDAYAGSPSIVWLQGAAAFLAVGALVLIAGASTQRVALQQDFSRVNQMMAQKVQQDEMQLQSDVQKQQQMLKHEGVATQILEKREYPDGCVCECAASGCDEENHEGPVCKCPTDGKETSLPDQFEPWPFHMPGAARSGRSQGMPQQALYGGGAPQMMQPHTRPTARARFQQKWVGSPQKFLPPDGDYPGGSTGVPLDGYLAYETGWANDGPFHGELAPMQEAGIADKAQRPQSLRAMPAPRQLTAARAHKKMYATRARTQSKKSMLAAKKSLLGDDMFGVDFDERVPAQAVDSDLFARSHTKSATLDAFDSLVR